MRRSFMSLRGGRDEEEGGERGLMEDEEGELDLDGIDLSPEELAMLDKMFQVRVSSTSRGQIYLRDTSHGMKGMPLF
jgi:hypothetical protein